MGPVVGQFDPWEGERRSEQHSPP